MARLSHDQNVEWVQTDFTKWNISGEKADKILLDAPCTGLGILRRHPEGKWQKDEASIKKLSSIQKDLITHALKQIKVGGLLIYSVCSFEPEESIRHLKWLLSQHKDSIEQVSPVSLLPGYFKRYVTKENLLIF